MPQNSTSLGLYRGCFLLSLVASSCGGEPADEDQPSAGGTSTGGQIATMGGAAGTSISGRTAAVVVGRSLGLGGVTTNGGAVLLGGAENTGGRSSSSVSSAAGASAKGGTSGSGGSTAAARGGSSNGGTTATSGGAVAKGGTSSAGGGSSASGGSVAKGGTTAIGGSSGATANVTVYIAGDSTVCNYTDTAATNDQAGWGQMLKEIFNSKVTIQNRAVGGRTAYWFYLEGAVDKILSTIKPGDYFFIQFGTNDQNQTATFTVGGVTYPRYADAATTFRTQLKQYYLNPTKAKGAIPVLVTPPPRNSAYCNGGNGLSAYATAMKELGAAEKVAVLDNNLSTFNYLKAICPKPTTAATENFFLGKSDGSIDGTHFQENGARKMAGFIGTRIREVGLGLAAYLVQ
ncbi:MAG: GDSL-type esterase/lipase family protein [Polyangiaceae bacterium]